MDNAQFYARCYAAIMNSGLDSEMVAGLLKILNTPPTTSRPILRKKRSRIDYCNLCQKNINENVRRCQGPRRHVLQFHMTQAIFFCPHCPASSRYDKAHIKTHMARMHKDLGGEVRVADKKDYSAEEEEWFDKCFRTSNSPANSERNSVDSISNSTSTSPSASPDNSGRNSVNSTSESTARSGSPAPSEAASDVTIPAISTDFNTPSTTPPTPQIGAALPAGFPFLPFFPMQPFAWSTYPLFPTLCAAPPPTGSSEEESQQ